MRNALVIAALTLASASAFASKARVDALQGSKTAAWDIQDMFTNPAKATALGSLLTVEFGSTWAGTTPTNGNVSDFTNTAEGGFLRADGDQTWGVYLGRKSYDNYLSKALTGATYLDQSNPLELMYGRKAGAGAWAVSLNYSEGKDTATAGEKNNAYGVRGGFVADNWNAFADIGLASTAQTDTQDYKGNIGGTIGGEFDIHDMKLYASYTMFGGKNSPASGDVKSNIDATEIGVEHKLKTDASHFFYGAKFDSANIKTDTGTTMSLATWKLPLYVGIEADAASWMVARFALSQSLFNYQNGRNPAAPATYIDKTDYSDTTATLGIGLKFAKLTVDGMLSAGSTGNLNFNDGNGANSFMSEVSATYMF